MVDTADKNNNEVPVSPRKKFMCPHCEVKLEYRIPRGLLVKLFLFWWPVRRFQCFKCMRKIYVWGKFPL